jgi:hypothetical protein
LARLWKTLTAGPMDIHQSSASVLHILEHAATVTLGLALVILGLAMTFTIVFTLPGIVALTLGSSLIVAGLFAHVMANARRR